MIQDIRSKYFILFILLLTFTSLVLGEVFIVPKPKEMSSRQDIFRLNETVGLFTATKDTNQMLIGINQLITEFSSIDGAQILIGEQKELMIWLGIPGQDEEFQALCKQKGFWPDNRIGNEGYVLDIGPEEIIIAAKTKTGIFYGIQSLKQIIRGGDKQSEIPCLRIVDWPDLNFRGVQDDISRGPVPTMAFMKSQVRRLSELKINRLSYYIEHIVKTKSHGDFAPAGGGVSIEEWKELSDYAANYHMEVVANFQSLGHFEKILSYPQYRPLGETSRMLSPIRMESFQFLADVYAEMAPVFSSEFFNVNCDETWDLGRDESKKYIDSLGIGRVYADHILRIYKELKKYNKKIMVWGDIILSHPEILDMLPKDIMMGAWTYGADDPFSDYFMPFKQAGFEFMYSCGVLNSNRLIPDYRMTMANIRNFTHVAAREGTVGMLCTVWDDGGNAFFPLDWYGVAYAADQSWHLNDDEISTYDMRFDRGIYGNLNGAISKAFRTLIPITDLADTFEMNDLVLWKQIIPERGKSIQLGGSDWMEVRAIASEAKAKLALAKPKIYEEDLPFIQLIIDEYDYMATSRFDLLKAAQLYKNSCFVQNDSREHALSDGKKALKLLISCRQGLEDLKEFYAELWLVESKRYWLDHLMDQFDEKIADYEHAEKLLTDALGKFSEGEYLLPPNEIRLDIEEQGGKYFQYWLLCGPFPNVSWVGRETDYLKPIGSEAGASPTPGLFFESEKEGTKYWVKYSSPLNSRVDLSSIYEKKDRVVTYAFCRIYSPTGQMVKASFGSNDGIQIFLNGKRIYKIFAKRSLILDEDKVMLDLKKGRNDMLLKIDQNKGAWGFSFRLPEKIVRSHKYKYYIVEE